MISNELARKVEPLYDALIEDDVVTDQWNKNRALRSVGIAYAAQVRPGPTEDLGEPVLKPSQLEPEPHISGHSHRASLHILGRAQC